jgi:hypothetical protein
LNKLEYDVFYEGRVFRLIWGTDASGRKRGKEYFDAMTKKDQTAIEARLRRYADHGRLGNETQFRYEVPPTFAFKIFKHRIVGFRRQNDVILIDGFVKKADSDRRVDRNLRKAAERASDWLERASQN